MAYDRKVAKLLSDDGKDVIAYLEVMGVTDKSVMASLEKEAEAKKAAIAQAKSESEAKEKEELSEEAEKAAQLAYYARWRFAVACLSLCVRFAAGDTSVSEADERKAVGAMFDLRGSSDPTCEAIIASHDSVIKAEYESIFGKREG